MQQSQQRMTDPPHVPPYKPIILDTLTYVGQLETLPRLPWDLGSNICQPSHIVIAVYVLGGRQLGASWRATSIMEAALGLTTH